MSKDMGVPFLGRLPLDPIMMQACENGHSYLPQSDGESEVKSDTAAQAHFRKLVGGCSPLDKVTVDAVCESLWIGWY